jgi:hypothetical protein
MRAYKSELPVPATLDQAEKAMEMVRVWIVDGDQHVVLSPNLWPDPGAWGLMLADLARHVAAAYEAQGHDRVVVLQRIHEAFVAEWLLLTDRPD